MTYDFIFVHGTGVREPAYSKTFNAISKRLRQHNQDIRIHRCYWGGILGSSTFASLASLPAASQKKSIGDQLDPAEETLELWRILYQDPLFELKTLSLSRGQPARNFALGQGDSGKELGESFQRIDFSSNDMAEILDLVGIDESLMPTARDEITRQRDYKESLASAQAPLEDYRVALARALVAHVVGLAQESDQGLAISLDAAHRDQLVELLSTSLELQKTGQSKALGIRWMQNTLKGLLARFGTSWVRDRRHTFSEGISAGVGDILMYQARGESIRNYIRELILPLQDPVVLLAHSLGGIACIDLLILDPEIRERTHLIVTVGSQSPALYEINALVSQPYDENYRLPQGFPRWLNIYDRNDFLSYVGRPIFKGFDGNDFVEDLEVLSGQPFPLSHGAYWIQELTWQAIFNRLS